MAEFNFNLGSGATNQGSAPQQQAQQTQLGRGGMVGGGVLYAPQAVDPRTDSKTDLDRTLDTVLSVGQSILGQKMKQAENQAFLQGVQRTMQGEALKDIVDEQPWYSKIFGPSSTVQGAQAYTQLAQVDKYTASLYGDMPRLAKLSPDEAGKEVTARMSKFLTGDEATDTAIQMKMVEQAGPFFKAQAKANFTYQQNTMKAAVSESMISAGDSLQAAATQWATDGTSNEKDRSYVLNNAYAAMTPPEGIEPGAYWDAITDSVVVSMAKGNHYMAQAVFAQRPGPDGKPMGSLFDAMPVEKQKELLDARDTYEAKTKAKEGSLEFGIKMGEIKGQMATGQIAPAQGVRMMEEVNTQFRMKTGIDGDLFDKKDFASYIASDYKAFYAAQQAAAKARQEGTKSERTLVEQTQSTRAAFMVGSASLALSNAVPRQVVDNTVIGAMNEQAANGIDPLPLLVKNFIGDGMGAGGYINEQLKNGFNSGIVASTSGYTPLLDQSVQQYDRLMAAGPGGQATAQAYFGAENSVKIENYKQYTASGMPPEVAWQASFGSPVNTLQTTPKAKIEKEILDKANSDNPGFVTSLITGEQPLSKNNVGVLATEMARQYDVFKSQIGMSDEAAMASAANQAKLNVDVVGSYAYRKSSPNQLPVNQLIGADPVAAGRAVNDFFAVQANKQGFKLPGGDAVPQPKGEKYTNLFGGTSRGSQPWNGKTNWNFEQWGKDKTDSVTLMRLPDAPDGTAKFVMTGTTEDGKNVYIPATSKEIRSFYESQSYFNE
jgi:hypothetical protein